MTNWLSPNPFGSNPKTPCTAIAQIGDVNPIDYGGGFVFKCKDVGRPAHYVIEYTFGVDTDYDQESKHWERLTLYRVDIPEGGEEFWRHFNWTATPESIRSVSRSMSIDEDELIALGTSSDPIQRARAIESIAGYYGWHELDTYPIEFSPSELRRRWRAALKKKL